MPEKKKPSRKRSRALFRWFRIFTLFFLFIAIVAGLYFSTIGLPGFLKRPLLEHLRKQGWDVTFSGMHWHWFRGVVIMDAAFSRIHEPIKFSARETDLNIDLAALRRSEFKLNALLIEKGHLTWQVSTNHPPLSIEDVRTRLYFGADDKLELEPLEASFRNARITITGALNHWSALRDYKPKLPKEKRSKIDWEKVMALLAEINWEGTPEIKLDVSADARDWKTINGSLKLGVAQAATPWGTFTKFNLAGDLKGGDEQTFDLRADLGAAAVPWGTGTNINCQCILRSNATNDMFVETTISFSGEQLHSCWLPPSDNAADKHLNGPFVPCPATNTATAEPDFARAARMEFNSHSTHTWTNFNPLAATGKVKLLNGDFRLTQNTNRVAAGLNEGEIQFTFDPEATHTLSAETGFWKKFEPFTFDWKIDARDIVAPSLQMNELRLAGKWNAPQLTISNLDAALYQGVARASGTLDVHSREFKTDIFACFDGHKIAPLLPRGARRFLAKFHWENPPSGEGEISAILPSWTNRAPDWEGEFLPTLKIDASVRADHKIAYRSVEAEKGNASISYSNRVWRLPRIEVQLPSGHVQLSHTADERTGEYSWKVDGWADPTIVGNELSPKQKEWLDRFRFTDAPEMHAEILGRWPTHRDGASPAVDEIGISARIAATNFTFQGEQIDQLNTRLEYTNQLAVFRDVHLERLSGKLDSPEVMVDFQGSKIFFAEVNSTVDPMFVARCVGPHVVEAIEPYRFADPPRVRMNGALHFKNQENTDLQFEVSGGKFEWGYFRADAVTGRLDWKGPTLALTNGVARGYDTGNFAGWAFLTFSPSGKADYRLNVQFSDVNAHAVNTSLTPGTTNAMEGLIEGQLDLISADTSGLHTWQGTGNVALRNGLIWEIPVFGIFSPVLDAIVPGLGKNRAKHASASFVITNGVARTEDLEIRASTLRIQYRGTVDYAGKVEARVEAEILRDAFLIGRLVSLTLMPLTKLFEYKVTGNIEQPKMDPVYIPKFLLMTLRPFHTLKSLLPDKEK